MRGFSTPNRAYKCSSYAPGHEPHFIQARLGWGDPDRAPVPGRLLDAQDDGTIIVEDLEGLVIRLWNHDPERIERLTATNNGEITLQLGLHLINIRSDTGRYVFCVCPEEERTLCGPHRLPGKADAEQPFGYRPDLDQLTFDEQREHFRRIDKVLLEEFFLWNPDWRYEYD